jgi:hypothetical protein
VAFVRALSAGDRARRAQLVLALGLLALAIFGRQLPAGVLAITACVTAMAIAALSIAATRSRRARLARVRADVDALLAHDDASAARVAALLSELHLGDVDAEALLHERALLRTLNDEHVLHEAHAEVADHLSPFPRSTKRFLNQVRVLAGIAAARGVAAGERRPSPRHFGRYALLKERWPQVAAAFMRDPRRAAELERCADAGDAAGVAGCLTAWGAGLDDPSRLTAFLQSGSVRLGEVAESVVHFLPA